MLIKTIPLQDMIETNAYFYIDEISKHGFLIDPGAQPEILISLINKNKWIIEKILLTHSHFDHIGAVESLSKNLQIPYYIHQSGTEILKNPQLNLSIFTGKEIKLNNALYFNDNDEILLEANPQIKLQVLHTPGHTPDGVTFYDENNHVAFVGDTIFKDSIGATHFPGGDYETLINSIRHKILTLPDNTVLYSGHTQPTTVKAEKSRF